MNPWKVLALLASSRLRCWLLGHRETTQIRGEYVIVYCERCYAATVDLVQPCNARKGAR